MMKEEKHVAKLNEYIAEQQKSKVALSKELKSKIKELNGTLAEYKKMLASNITFFNKK